MLYLSRDLPATLLHDSGNEDFIAPFQGLVFLGGFLPRPAVWVDE